MVFLDQFPVILYWYLVNINRFFVGNLPQHYVVSVFLGLIYENYVRPVFCYFQVELEQKSLTFLHALTQTSFLFVSIHIQVEIKQIMSQAVAYQFPSIFNKKQSDAVMGCPRPVSVNFQFKSEQKSIRFYLGLLLISFLLFSRRIQQEIKLIRSRVVPEQFPVIFKKNWSRNESGSVTGCRRQVSFHFLSIFNKNEQIRSWAILYEF